MSENSLCETLRQHAGDRVALSAWPRRLHEEPDGRLRRIRSPSLRLHDIEPRGAGRLDQLLELEEGRHERHRHLQKPVALELTLALVSGDQDATAGSEQPDGTPQGPLGAPHGERE